MFQILYFSTTWCGPCKAMAPVVAEASQTINIEKVDAEQNPQLSAQYNIRTVPTFIFLKNGQEVGRKSGAMRKQDFENLAKMHS